MLILSRKQGEKLFIDVPGGYVAPPEGVRVEVVMFGYGGRKGAKLGIYAPQEFTVNRQEVSERIARREESE